MEPSTSSSSAPAPPACAPRSPRPTPAPRSGCSRRRDQVGGTTALASAVAWIPNNKYAAAAGVPDSREDALAYLASLSHGMILPELAEALVDTGPELVDWLESSTPLQLRLVPGFPDYHPEHPGGKPRGGRSLEPELFSFSRARGVGRPHGRRAAAACA